MFNRRTVRRYFSVSRDDVEAFCIAAFGAAVLAVIAFGLTHSI